MLTVLKTRVALQRIETFLNEDEVDEQVSTIKRSKMGPTAPSFDEFGLRDASFKWNAVEEKEKEKKDDIKGKSNGKVNGSTTDASGGDIEAEAVDAVAAALTEETDRIFELRDISVIFPEGELSVVTGPTASGKTALLVCFFSFILLFHDC